MSRISIFSRILIVLSLITCLSSAPYLGHYLFGSKYVLVSGGFSLLVFWGAYYSLKTKSDTWIKVITLFMFSFILYGSWMVIVESSYDDLRKSIGMMFKCLYVIGSCFIIKRYFNAYLKLFFCINSVMVVLSIILFFIVISGIPLDPIPFTKLDGRPHYIYFPFGTTNVRMEFGAYRFIRNAGFADEPGAFALILSYLLIINEFTFKSNKYRFLYVIGAFFTFSMAFFITFIPIVFYWIKSSVVSFKKVLLGALCIIILLLVVVQKNAYVYEGLDTLIFNRFKKNDNGEYNGDNRSFAIPKQMKAFDASPLWGVGVSPDNIRKYQLDYPSFFSYIAMHGIIGNFLFYAPFLFLFVKNIHKKESWLFISLILNFLQRPSIEEMFALISLSLIFYSSFYEKPQNQYYNRFI